MEVACWTALIGLMALGIIPAAWGIYPGRRMGWLLAVPMAAAAMLVFFPEAAAWLFGIDVGAALFMGIELRRLPKREDFRVERQFIRIASLKRRHRMTVRVNNGSGSAWNITVRDDLSPDDGEIPEDLSLRIDPDRSLQWTYHWIPRRRGVVTLRFVHLRIESPWQLWYRLVRVPAQADIHVYPNIRQLEEYALLVRTNRLNLLGVRRIRKWGQDHDFERLRDYTPDDNYRHIEWRATARRRKLTVKDFQTSQSQRLMLLIDCGRMMISRFQDATLLDHALNAALMLAFAALRQGDAVGLICFAERLSALVPPRSGMGQLRHLVRGVFDQQATMVQPRYDQLLGHLAAHCRKRALLVLISNVVDHVSQQQMERFLAAARRRHLTLAVLLRDPALFSPLENIPAVETQAWYRAAAAAVVAQWRADMILALQHAGHLVLDTPPQQLTASLISEYLAVKAAHLL